MALLFVLAGKLEAVSSCTNMGAGCGWVVKLKASDGAARTSRDTDRSTAVTSYASWPWKWRRFAVALCPYMSHRPLHKQKVTSLLL